MAKKCKPAGISLGSKKARGSCRALLEQETGVEPARISLGS